MKKCLVSMVVVSLIFFNSAALATESADSKAKEKAPPIFSSWKLTENKLLPLCQEFESYLNQFPNAYMEQKFEPHKHIKDVKFPTLTPISEEEFLRIYKQRYEANIDEGYPAYFTLEQKVAELRASSPKFYQFRGDVNHDGEIETVYIVFNMPTPKLDFIAKVPSALNYVLNDQNNYDARFKSGFVGIPFFNKGRFYLFNSHETFSTIYETYNLNSGSIFEFFKYKDVCNFTPTIAK